MRTVILTLCVGTWMAGCATQPRTTPAADLLLTGASVYSGDRSSPFSTDAVLIQNGRIAWVGDEATARRMAPSARVIDLAGHTVLPGLIDAHAHIAGLGLALDSVSLVGSTSEVEMLERVAARHNLLPSGEWLVGRGWDQNEWQVREFPTAADLDRVVGDRPVWLVRIDGHAALASSAAMKAAGISRTTPDPDGGRIIRDDAGNATGVFIDNAMDLVTRVVPEASRERQKQRLESAAREIVRNGLTAVHDAGTDQTTIDLLRELADEGRLPLRVYVMLSDNAALLDSWFSRGPLVDPAGRVQVRSVKLYADGALGSRGAALLAPYADDPHNTGLMLTTPEHVVDVARRARAAGFQVGTHAIGDAAVKAVLDAYEQAGVGRKDRFRIEHLQVATRDDLMRTARLGVIASMQPTHATSDMNWAEDRVGSERIRGAYAWKSLADADAVLAFGSDFPVELVNPLLGIRASVLRQDVEGAPPGGWQPQERLTVEQAIDAFTSGAAYASFTEDVQGRIAPGFLGDVTVIAGAPEDLVNIPDVRMTIVDGVVVYESN